MRLDSLYVALPWSLLFFLAMTGVGHLSYKLIESPPLRFRKSYIRVPAATGAPLLAG